MKLHKDSHTDHVPDVVLRYILDRYMDRTGFFIATAPLPDYYGSEALPDLECALFGPVMGDDPIPESIVWYGQRPGRTHHSRLVSALPRKTRLLTVIAGPYMHDPCVLFTAFGGPPSPKELLDTTLPSSGEEREESERFWAEHALAAHTLAVSEG